MRQYKVMKTNKRQYYIGVLPKSCKMKGQSTVLYLLEYQMCTNPSLKIVPNKYTFYSCLSDVC